jgi:hypothetical protein
VVQIQSQPPTLVDMATWTTPFEGRDNIVAAQVYVSGNLDLRLYTNAADSLSATTVLADLTAPVGSGYAIVTLAGSWSSSNGQVTYDHGTPDNVVWTAADSWSGGDVVGIAMTDGTYVLHTKDLVLGPVTMTAASPPIEVDLSTFISV